MKTLSTFVMAALLSVAFFSNADAIMLNATKDAYVYANAANANFGSEQVNLLKRQGSTQHNRKSYIGFDLSGLGPAPITAATLTLNFVDSNLGTLNSDGLNTAFEFELFGLMDQTLDGWGENSITWNNAPANMSGYSLGASAVSLGTFSLLGKGIGTYDFSSLLLADFLNADTNNLATLILRRNTDQTSANVNTYVHAFASLESQAGAKLTIEQMHAPIPEPSTVILLGAGLAGLGFMRWRRKS